MTQPFHCSLITKDVLQLTNRIQHSFPGLYAHLDETPLYLSSSLNAVTQSEIDAYYQSLKDQTSMFVLSRSWL